MKTINTESIVNETTKALLQDLQNDLDAIKSKKSNIEVVWELENMARMIKETKKLILKSI